MLTQKHLHQKPLNNRLKIKVNKNGPYIVYGGIPLEEYIIIRDNDGISYKWLMGKKYAIRDTYQLCRCGQSKNRPFCDGTHLHVHFNGTETSGNDPYLNQAKDIKGPDLNLTDNKSLCVHAGFCDRAGGIWKLVLESSNPKLKRIAIEEAINCPSGRLVVWDKAGGEIEPELEPSIALIEDPQEGCSGPLWVRGYIPIESADGIIYELRNRITLCRCGKSANKPFCDGRHKTK